jgi:hypothetical protein
MLQKQKKKMSAFFGAIGNILGLAGPHHAGPPGHGAGAAGAAGPAGGGGGGGGGGGVLAGGAMAGPPVGVLPVVAVAAHAPPTLQSVADSAARHGIPLHPAIVVQTQVHPPPHLASMPTQALQHVVVTATRMHSAILNAAGLVAPDVHLMSNPGDRLTALQGYFSQPENEYDGVTRPNPGIASLQEVVETKHRFNAVGVESGDENLPRAGAYQATVKYLSLTKSKCLNFQGIECYMNESSIEALHFLHLCLSVSFPEIFLKTQLGKKALKQLRIQQLGIAAFIIYTLGMGCDPIAERTQAASNLQYFQDHEKEHFYAFIIPLVKIVSLMMDHHEERLLFECVFFNLCRSVTPRSK